MILDYFTGPNIIMRALKRERNGQESERKGCDCRLEGAHKLRNVGSL